MVSEGGAWMVSEDEDLVVLPLTLIIRGFLHAPGGRLALRPFPLLEIPLLSVRTVEMGVPLLNNRSFENCHRFRINHVAFPGKFRFANRTFKILKRRSSENGPKICFWHERQFPTCRTSLPVL